MTILEQEGFQTFRYYISLKSAALLSKKYFILFTLTLHKIPVTFIGYKSMREMLEC